MKLSSRVTRMLKRVRSAKQVQRFAFAVRGIPFAMAGLSLLAAKSAIALPSTEMSFPHAKTPSFLWYEPIEMQVSGVPVVVRGFTADLTLEDAARLMARHRGHFQRVTTLPGSILLSGVHGGRHWVAQLDSGQGRIKGMVSALPLDVKSIPQERSAGVLTPWLTHNASLVFAQSSRIGNRPVNQSVHRPVQSLDTFLGSMDLYLQRSGWSRAGAHSWIHDEPGAGDYPRSIDVNPVVKGSEAFVFVSQSG